MKIYTKTGDKGETSLLGGKRVSKADLRVEAYGTVDELNSVMGMVISKIRNPNIEIRNKQIKSQTSNFKSQTYILDFKTVLISIQKDLMEIGSILASIDSYSSNEEKRSREVSKKDSFRPASWRARTINNLQKKVTNFENLIDEMDKSLPELKNFVLPGGGEAGALLNLARTVCRRAERRIVDLSQKEDVDEEILIYFNRLSDLLFTMGRFINHKSGKKEIIWSKIIG